MKPLWPESNDTNCVICDYKQCENEDELLEHNKSEEHMVSFLLISLNLLIER